MNIQELKNTESDRLKVQIQAYLDNMFDVSSLLEDSEIKLSALERVDQLEEQLFEVTGERFRGVSMEMIWEERKKNFANFRG